MVQVQDAAQRAHTKERGDRWDPEVTYVIGHQRPDTDAIASALGYAWFLNQIGKKVTPARAGQPGEQALFALSRFSMAPPMLLTGVAPTFGHCARHQGVVAPDAPLPAAMARVAEGDRIVPVVDPEGKPVGVVTSLALARAYMAPMNVTAMLAQPCLSIAETPVVFRVSDRISDYRNQLLRSETDDFLVVSETGRYVGVATRSRILQPPRARLILVDHNELSQAVADAEEAEIVGVLDHHRLGNPPTAAPIPFLVDPVGSTCTLIAEQCQAHKLEPPEGLAGMMLSGILSDTLVLRSPTTTERDRAAAEWLARLAKVELEAYGQELLHAAPGLTERSADEILDGDRKSYQMGGVAVSIGQVEVTGMESLAQRREELLQALEERREREGLALIGLMVTDIVTGRSHLLCRGEPWILTALPFTRVAEGEFDLEDMVSRKKQLVPMLHAVLEEAF
ncbi:DHHA2 domain-containing protein [Chthonomonas calidirosea]|uniref:DHHA2 domain-containing protein n=1 Tax=Chthonomonas calidirosea TaxID=454171 RepID=UPI0006EC5CE9|nr:DHHA2 domain-containing protein [Chthonomonas calidirosea]CEK15427.1 inorganic pyrophosphatase/exopolyphosphatase [Chthonomonas calidirosea]